MIFVSLVYSLPLVAIGYFYWKKKNKDREYGDRIDWPIWASLMAIPVSFFITVGNNSRAGGSAAVARSKIQLVHVDEGSANGVELKSIPVDRYQAIADKFTEMLKKNNPQTYNWGIRSRAELVEISGVSALKVIAQADSGIVAIDYIQIKTGHIFDSICAHENIAPLNPDDRAECQQKFLNESTPQGLATNG